MMIVADMVSLRERAKFIAIIAITGAIANISDIVLGGAIAEKSSWRL
jgi:predicted MFS family arabinose efflux permease